MSDDLTIAIPTYNRCAAVEAVVRGALPAVAAGDVRLLVVDDGSSDGTFERLQPLAGEGVRILGNEENLGYPLTLCRILREVDTEWVLVTADDDQLDVSRLAPLTTWLHAERPDFVSTQWRKQPDTIYRGRAASEPIVAKDLLGSASHAPGLIYRAAAARSSIPLLEEHLAAGSDAATAYPQVVLAAQLIATGRAMWWGGTIVSQGEALPSGVNDAVGRHYWDPASRLSQGLAFDRLFRQMEQMATDDHGRDCARQWRRGNEAEIYPSVRTALLFANKGSADRAGDARRLDRSVRRYVWRTTGRAMVEAIPGGSALLARLGRS